MSSAQWHSMVVDAIVVTSPGSDNKWLGERAESLVDLWGLFCSGMCRLLDLGPTQQREHVAGRAQGSSVVTKIGVVLQTPTAIPDVIGSALTSSSNFFINYVAIQVSPPSVTAQGKSGTWGTLCRSACCDWYRRDTRLLLDMRASPGVMMRGESQPLVDTRCYVDMACWGHACALPKKVCFVMRCMCPQKTPVPQYLSLCPDRARCRRRSRSCRCASFSRSTPSSATWRTSCPSSVRARRPWP